MLDGPELYAYTSLYILNFIQEESQRRKVIASVMPGYFPEDNGRLTPMIRIDCPPTIDVAVDVREWTSNLAGSIPQAGDDCPSRYCCRPSGELQKTNGGGINVDPATVLPQVSDAFLISA